MKQLVSLVTIAFALGVHATSAGALPCTPQYEWRGERLSGLGLVRAEAGYLATWMDGDRERYRIWNSALDQRVADGERAGASTYGRSWWRWVGGASDFLRIAASGNTVQLGRVGMSAETIDAVNIDTGHWVESVDATFDGTAYVVAATVQIGSSSAVLVWRFAGGVLDDRAPDYEFRSDTTGEFNVYVRTIGSATWIVWSDWAGTAGVRLAVADGQLLDAEPIALAEREATAFATRGQEGAVFTGIGRVLLDDTGVVFVVSQAPRVQGRLIGTDEGYVQREIGRVWDFPELSTNELVRVSANTYELTKVELDNHEAVFETAGQDLVMLSLTDTVSASYDTGSRALRVQLLSPDGAVSPIPAESSPIQSVEHTRWLIRDCPEPPPGDGGVGEDPGPIFGSDDWDWGEQPEGCSATSGSGAAPVLLALALLFVWRRKGARSRV